MGMKARVIDIDKHNRDIEMMTTRYAWMLMHIVVIDTK